MRSPRRVGEGIDQLIDKRTEQPRMKRQTIQERVGGTEDLEDKKDDRKEKSDEPQQPSSILSLPIK